MAEGGRKMKELIEKLKNYNRWRRGDETVPQPHPQEVGEMIDQTIEALEGFQFSGLRVLNDELSRQSVEWPDGRLLLSKAQRLAEQYGLKSIDAQYEGFTMMVEPDSDIESLAAEFEEWKKQKE